MFKKIKINNYFTIVLTLLLLASCDANRIFDEYFSLKSGSWNKETPVNFSFEIQDTIHRNNLFINLRNNNNYEFSNLFLITQLNFPDGQRIIDTLEYDMADKSGKFLGTGFSEIKENKLFYKENITFPISGNYSISIAQAMRKSNEIDGIIDLKGITDVGFRIEKIE